MVPMAEEPPSLCQTLPLQETRAKTSRLLTTVVLRWPTDPSRRGNHANPGWAGLANGYQAAGVGLVSVVPTAREVMRALGKSCR